MEVFFSSITGRQILLKVFTRRRCVSPFPKVGSAGEVIGDEDNDASGSSVADADALYRAACDKSFSPLHCTPWSWGTDGLDFYLCFLQAGEIKTFFTAVMRFI